MWTDLEFHVFRLLAREIETLEFEQWLYTSEDLEQVLGPGHYLDLISLDYRSPSARYDAEKILKQHVETGRYCEWRLRRILQRVIDPPGDVHRDIEQCYTLYCDGYEFLDVLGLGYGLSIASPPSSYGANSWDDLETAEQEELLGSFYPGVREEALKVMGWFDSEAIVLTGHDGGYRGIQYVDRRSSTPPKSTPPTTLTSPKPWWKFW